MSDIVTQILEGAQYMATAVIVEAKAEAEKVIANAKAEAEAFLQKSREEIEALKDETIKRRITVAHLEARKILLAAKKKALDDIFARAAEVITSLPKEQYLAIIEGMLSHAEDGDTVKIARKDKAVITSAFIAGVAKEKGIKLTLSEEYADISGGIILSGGEVEKNLSLDVELRALREELEPRVAAKLFS